MFSRLYELVNKYADLVGPNQLPEPNEVGERMLYHYTTGPGALAILKGGCLWASHPFFMNDPNEMRQAAVTTASWTRDSIPQSPHSDAVWRALERARLNMDGVLTQTRLISFCEAGDLLSMWRTYGGAAGPAYAIALDATAVRRMAGRVTVVEGESSRFERAPGWWAEALFRVNYDLKAQRTYLRDVVDAISEDYATEYHSFNHETGDLALTAASALSTALLPAYSAFKSPGFHEEREWRLVARSGAPRGGFVHPTKYGLAPRLEMALEEDGAWRLPAVALVQGPSPYASTARHGMEYALQLTGASLPISQSTVEVQ